MNLLQALSRSYPRPLTLDDWYSYFNPFGTLSPTTTLRGNTEELDGTFSSLAAGAFRSNSIVFACMATRQLLFSEARFRFRSLQNGVPGNLFWTPALAALEKPWPNGTTADLLGRAIQDADLSGNAYFVRRPSGRIKRLRPDWVVIVLGSRTDPDLSSWDPDAEVIGYVYYPGGQFSGADPVVFLPGEVAHFIAHPDPVASYRGMSWLTPLVREVMADSAATSHKLKFFENGATPNMVVSLDLDNVTKFNEWVTRLEEKHAGLTNAYKTLYLGAGAKAEVVGNSLQQMDFKLTQGAGETRIAAAAGLHPTIVGLSEGLQGSSLNAGNFGAARRLVADKTMRPLWRNFAGSMASIVDVPASSELWYDDEHIPFLKEDVRDAADIQSVQAQSMKSLIDAGFDPLTVIDAVTSGDLTRLSHTGLYSVQLQPAGTVEPSEPADTEDDDGGPDADRE